MPDDTTILRFPQPGSILGPLTEIARDGARRMLMAALKAQACSLDARFSEGLLADGRQRVVRHGSGPERVIRTGIGPVEVRRQKVRDRATEVPAGAKVGFTSNILPKWARRAKSLDALLGRVLVTGVVIARHRHDGGVEDLTAPRNVALPRKMTVKQSEQRLDLARLAPGASRYSHTVLASGTRSPRPSPSKRMNDSRSRT